LGERTKETTEGTELFSVFSAQKKNLNRRERRDRGEFSGEKPLNISFFLFDSLSIILSVLGELRGELFLTERRRTS